MKSVKSRVIACGRTTYKYGTRNPPPLGFLDINQTQTHSLFSTQTTESEGHPFGRLSRTDEDLGGEFFTSRCVHSHNCPHLLVWSSTNPGVTRKYFEGTLYPKRSSSVQGLDLVEPVAPSSIEAIDAAGTIAISKILPTNPVSGLAVTFGELREGFPKMIGSTLFKKGKILSKSGDEFLNWEFGWKPLIADFKKWLHAYRKADLLWDQFVRDSGRRVRRRYTFPKTTEVLLSDVTPAIPAGAGHIDADLWQGGNMTFPLYTEKVLERNRWFSGAFTYYLPDDKSERGEFKRHTRRLQYLYGTKITPEVIWNLAPWSWAADWVANMGAVITNMTRFSEDGLVMPYGYMMELSVLKATYRMRNVTPKGYNIPDMTQVFTNTVKYRRRATPYGFGLDEGSFTPRQWAIIAALGLSRAR